MTTPTSATLAGTLRYRQRFKDSAAENHFREQHSLCLSSIGTGTYLGNADDETDRRYTTAIGRAVEARFRSFVERFAFVGDARGLGAMRALELVKDKGTKEPDKDRTDRVIKLAYESGLLLVGAGTYGNVIRTLMPLVITDDELAEGLDVLEHALQKA